MGTINGYAIVTRRNSANGYVVLGMRANHLVDSGFEYVIAWIPSIGAHYFTDVIDSTSFDEAVEAYKAF